MKEGNAMEPIILHLDGEGASAGRLRFQWTLFLLVGLLNLVQGFIVDNDFHLINLFAGLLFIVLALLFPIMVRPKSATFDDKGISRRLGWRRSVSLTWDQIAYMEATIFTFRIHAKDGKQFELDLGGLTFEEHSKLKPKVIELARGKGIEVKSV
jgi:hypothetical protein